MNEFLNAIKKGDLEKVKKYIEEQEIYINGFGSVTLNQPIVIAAIHGHLSIVEYLLKKGFGGKGGYLTRDAFCESIEHGQLSILKYLLENGISLGDDFGYNYPPLKIAIKFRHFAIVEFLIHKGADLNLDKEGTTALHLAAELGDLPVVQLLVKFDKNLIESSLKPNRHGDSRNDETPLRSAAVHGHVEIVEYLLANGACIETIFKTEITPIECVLNNHKMSTESKMGVINCLLDYIKKLKRLQKSRYWQRDILYNALGECKDKRIASLLLKRGVYIEVFDDSMNNSISKNYPLYRASYNLTFYAVKPPSTKEDMENFNKELGILGKNVNARLYETGNAALHLSISNNHTALVKLLLERGADVLLENRKKESGLSLIKANYKNDAYLTLLANFNALVQTDESLRKRKKYYLLSENAIGNLAKESVLLKEQKEQKERKETKEENKEKILFEKENAEDLKKCTEYLNAIVSTIDKLSIKEIYSVCLKVGLIVGKHDVGLFSPFIAYSLLSRVLELKLEEKEETIQEIHECMLESLLSGKVVFDMSDLSGEIKPIPIDEKETIEGDRVEEDKNAREYRVFKIITHILYSKKTGHDDSLGRYIAEYTLGSEESIRGIKDVNGKTVESQLALIKKVKEQAEKLKKQDEMMIEYQKKMKAMEERIKQLEQGQITSLSSAVSTPLSLTQFNQSVQVTTQSDSMKRLLPS